MNTSRILAAVFALCLASCATQSTSWNYKTTDDKKTVLGRAGQTLSIQSESVTVQFSAPKGWKVVDALDEPLDWNFAANAPGDEREFGVVVRKDTKQGGTEIARYRDYLDNVHRFYDPKVCMSRQDPLTLKDGRSVTPYLFCSKYWKQRLVIIVPEGRAVTVFEFTAPTEKSLNDSLPLIRAMAASYFNQAKKA